MKRNNELSEAQYLWLQRLSRSDVADPVTPGASNCLGGLRAKGLTEYIPAGKRGAKARHRITAAGRLALSRHPFKTEPSVSSIRWDGSFKGANRVLRHMPDRTVGITGGAPGHPVQLFIQTKSGKQICEARPGDNIGVTENGDACVIALPQPARSPKGEC